MLYILTYYCGFVESFYEKSIKIIIIDYCLTQLSADFFYLLENFSVGGAEVIKVDLIGSYKPYIVMSSRCGSPDGISALKRVR